MNYTRNWILLSVWLIFVGFLFRPVFYGKAALPLDVMVGGYFPWLDYKWGYPVGVPYKNAALTDVFSQLYPWRVLVVDSLKKGVLPLWNPYSFAGYPLLANWQSAAFYPLNFFLLILGSAQGWTLLCFLQVFLSGVFAYLMFRLHRISKLPSFGGGVVFALSGFMMTYMEYNTTGQIFMWVPLLISVVKVRRFWYIPWIIFYILTGGFFQPALYALFISGFYCLITKLEFKKIIVYFGLGVLMSAGQLLPTLEMLGQSVRNVDPNIVNYHYGLLPRKIILTMLAPDFFGNPATGNYFGFMGYQETSGYAGILAIILLLGGVLNQKKPAWELKITAGVFLILGLVLAFDNPLSLLIYKFRIPLISTGYASRSLLLWSFSLAVFTALGLDNIGKRIHEKSGLLATAILGGIMIGYLICLKYLGVEIAGNYKVTLRNLALPFGFAGMGALILISKLNYRLKQILLLVIMMTDLGRYFIKFEPFSENRFANLQIPAIEFLQQNSESFRIERDKGSLPPNTWSYFKLSTPSGYDPLLPLEYGKLYQIYAHGRLSDAGVSRYAETENWDSPYLDLLGVKYVLTTKKLKGVIDKNGPDAGYKFDQGKYSQAFADNVSLVLENRTVMSKETRYTNYEVIEGDAVFEKLADDYDFKNKIILNKIPVFDKQAEDILLINDAFYPGWKAYVNGKETEIFKAFGALRAVIVPKGDIDLKFEYLPRSFVWGMTLMFLAIGVSGIGWWRRWRSG